MGIEFQCDSLKQNNNYTSLQNFIADNPEDMSSRILSHIQYMWGVKSIEGIVPKLNEVYIHTKELTTFLKNCRDILGIHTYVILGFPWQIFKFRDKHILLVKFNGLLLNVT